MGKIESWNVDDLVSKRYKHDYGTIEAYCKAQGFSRCGLYKKKQAMQGKAKDRKKHQNIVYFAVFGDHVKIGRTTMIRKRIEQLRVCNPIAMSGLCGISDPEFKLEKQLHDRFSKYRVRGEWFAMNDEIAEFMRENKGRVQ